MASEFISEGIAVPTPQESGGEAELIRLAKARCPEAWTEIYERHYPQLFRYVQARVSDVQTAEDLTATVFTEALKSIGSYQTRGRPLLAWLYTIARNVVNYHHRTQYRKQGRHGGLFLSAEAVAARLLGRAPAGGQPTIGSNSDLESPESLIEGWDLRQAVARLSEEQREVIILRYYVGLNTPEAASVLGKHERAVYSLQARAIKALRRHLLPQESLGEANSLGRTKQ